MANQLIPSPELAPPSVKHLPLDKRFELWAQLVDESEALLIAGLREKLTKGGDLNAAYRDWYSRHMDDHEHMLVRYAENLSRRERSDGK